ncbi:unnamed protein product [Trichogramma brassicae]|uniref:Uncharacterized protein n=1 Tax=Trichogramma brassicae TaxID=86971 RepID=A0A6H5IHI4_9HYME|nr:unnamed protein product [Trichogramma brassicae]
MYTNEKYAWTWSRTRTYPPIAGGRYTNSAIEVLAISIVICKSISEKLGEQKCFTKNFNDGKTKAGQKVMYNNTVSMGRENDIDDLVSFEDNIIDEISTLENVSDVIHPDSELPTGQPEGIPDNVCFLGYRGSFEPPRAPNAAVPFSGRLKKKNNRAAVARNRNVAVTRRGTFELKVSKNSSERSIWLYISFIEIANVIDQKPTDRLQLAKQTKCVKNIGIFFAHSRRARTIVPANDIRRPLPPQLSNHHGSTGAQISRESRTRNTSGVRKRLRNSVCLYASSSKLDVTECEQIAQKLQRTLLNLAADATKCMNDRVKVINRTVEPLQRQSKEILQNLSNIMTEAANCVKNQEGNFWSNLSCLAEKKIRAIWDLTRGVPSLTLKLAEFTGSALFSPIPTGYCLTRQSFDTAVEQSKSILRSVTQCAADRAEQLRTVSANNNNNNNYDIQLPINGSTQAAKAPATAA